MRKDRATESTEVYRGSQVDFDIIIHNDFFFSSLKTKHEYLLKLDRL